MPERFSRRRGLTTAATTRARDDVPTDLRRALLALFERQGYSPQDIGEWMCHLMRKIPSEQLGADPSWYVVSLMMERLPWHTVFDLVEKVCPGEMRFVQLAEDINECFGEYGVPWKIVDGAIEERGDEIHERLVADATAALSTAGRPTATAEIRAAIAALSGRPEPDVRASVSRAIGAVEALARDIANDPRATLGQLTNRLSEAPQLQQVMAKLWGYASEEARHVREGQSIEIRDAYLVVNICAALISHLSHPSRRL